MSFRTRLTLAAAAAVAVAIVAASAVTYALVRNELRSQVDETLLERAATLLRTTDWSVTRICYSVGLQSLGSFTTSFGRMFGTSPTAYRARYPSATALVKLPACVVRIYGRPPNPTAITALRRGGATTPVWRLFASGPLPPLLPPHPIDSAY